MSSGASAAPPYSPPSSGPEYLLLHQTVPVFKTNKKGSGIGGVGGVEMRGFTCMITQVLLLLAKSWFLLI